MRQPANTEYIKFQALFMAGRRTIYSLYKMQPEDRYYLLRTEVPAYSNASQSQEDLAHQTEQGKRERMLDFIAKKHGENKDGFKLIGEMQNYPIGAPLYAEKGHLALDIYFMGTAFAQPWIILGTAPSEIAFLAALNDDDELLALKPVGRPKRVQAIFLTENDLDLEK